MARVTERVMLYRSLMTSTVWAPTLDEPCVCVYVHFVCACFCLCMCSIAGVLLVAGPTRVYMCVVWLCVAAYLYSWLANMILGDDHLYIAWWWMGFPWVTGLHSNGLHCESVCVVQAGQEGGRAPFLSVSHWYSGLKWSVGHFCFIRS